MPCQWSESTPCPFSAPSDRFIEFAGREYCPLHLPLESPEKPNATVFAEQFQRLQHNGNTEFEGVTFPGAIAPNTGLYDARRPLNLRHCTFGDRSTFASHAVDFDLSGSRSVGTFGINIGLGPCNAICENITCQGEVTLDASDQPSTLTLRGSTFRAISRFNLVERMQFLCFDGCDFARAPSFGRTANLPQRTTFQDARFNPQFEDEGAVESQVFAGTLDFETSSTPEAIWRCDRSQHTAQEPQLDQHRHPSQTRGSDGRPPNITNGAPDSA
jgi:hypothetical protein